MAVELRKVQVPKAVFDGLMAAEEAVARRDLVRNLATSDVNTSFAMSDVSLVIQWLDRNDFAVTAAWIEGNIDPYCKGLVAGFEKEAEPVLKKLSDYTDAEKCAKFDKLFRMVLEEFEYSQGEGCGQKDFTHYLFEEVMSLLGGRDMWDAYNSEL